MIVLDVDWDIGDPYGDLFININETCFVRVDATVTGLLDVILIFLHCVCIILLK